MSPNTHLNLVTTAFGNDSRKAYPNDPKFSDIQALTNSAEPDQTAPTGAV